MQKTPGFLPFGKESSCRAFRFVGDKARACAIALFFALALLIAMPLAANTAYAKSYTMPQVDINATVLTDGSLHVQETRTFDFDGEFSAIWFTVEPPYDGSVTFNGVWLGDPHDIDQSGNVASTPLEKVSFDLSWRDEGGPDKTCYSVDSPRNTVYVFFAAADEQMVITIDYTVEDALGVYKDVGELYWKYVAPNWAEDSQNVTMTVKIPVPEGTEVVAGDNIRAWGHGPLDGSLAVNADGSVTYTCPLVGSGQYAEARIVFPTEWLSAVTTEDRQLHQNDERLQTVLSEEQDWADQANRQRIVSLLTMIAFALAAVLVVLWAALSWVRHGKEYKARFGEEYWRDVPDRNVHPAEIGRLWRFDAEKNDDLVATVMHLSHEGAILVNRGSYPEEKHPDRRVEDYYLTRVPEVADTLENPIDKATMKLLFEQVGAGSDQIWMGSIKTAAKDRPEEYVEWLNAWQGVLSGEVNKRDFFEAKGNLLQKRFVLLGVLLAIVGFAAWFFMDNLVPLLFLLPAGIATFAFGAYMPRRSREACELYAKCEALCRWLKDFSSLDERPPTDVKVWGEFMVYAYLFGVAQEAIKNLQQAVPEAFAVVDEPTGGYGPAVPWWFWYSAASTHDGTVVPSAGDFLSGSFTNAQNMAREAISAAHGESSSGFGGGGGFSVGGGGGFGGGGGGGAR